jgi:hypothetical protein
MYFRPADPNFFTIWNRNHRYFFRPRDATTWKIQWQIWRFEGRPFIEMFYNHYYNIAFVNSECWLAKSCVHITQCQHGNIGKFLFFFFVLYYKTNIKHFLRIDIQLYQHSWKLGKLEILWKHSALRASCFHTIWIFSFSQFPRVLICILYFKNSLIIHEGIIQSWVRN